MKHNLNYHQNILYIIIYYFIYIILYIIIIIISIILLLLFVYCSTQTNYKLCIYTLSQKIELHH